MIHLIEKELQQNPDSKRISWSYLSTNPGIFETPEEAQYRLQTTRNVLLNVE